MKIFSVGAKGLDETVFGSAEECSGEITGSWLTGTFSLHCVPSCILGSQLYLVESLLPCSWPSCYLFFLLLSYSMTLHNRLFCESRSNYVARSFVFCVNIHYTLCCNTGWTVCRTETAYFLLHRYKRDLKKKGEDLPFASLMTILCNRQESQQVSYPKEFYFNSCMTSFSCQLWQAKLCNALFFSGCVPHVY